MKTHYSKDLLGPAIATSLVLNALAFWALKESDQWVVAVFLVGLSGGVVWAAAARRQRRNDTHSNHEPETSCPEVLSREERLNLWTAEQFDYPAQLRAAAIGAALVPIGFFLITGVVVRSVLIALAGGAALLLHLWFSFRSFYGWYVDRVPKIEGREVPEEVKEAMASRVRKILLLIGLGWAFAVPIAFLVFEV